MVVAVVGAAADSPTRSRAAAGFSSSPTSTNSPWEEHPTLITRRAAWVLPLVEEEDGLVRGSKTGVEIGSRRIRRYLGSV